MIDIDTSEGTEMSDTPETDAALYPMNQVDIVWPEFARKLERERDEAIRQRNETNESSKYAVEYAQRERDEARNTALLYRSLYFAQNKLLWQIFSIRHRCKSIQNSLGGYEMRILTRDDTEHGVDYVTLAEAQTEVERLQRERDEARENAERYRLEANLFMLQRDKLNQDIHEQCRLLGMSAEREAGLRGKIEQLQRQLEKTIKSKNCLRNETT
jgi:hypothetical protein